MENIQPNYYAIIPANVRYDKNLSANAKLLYAEITALSQKDGKCWATNKYFAELYAVTTGAIQKWIKQLKDLGYLDAVLIYKDGTKEILKRYLTINPIVKKDTTPIDNFTGGSCKNLYDPHIQIYADNNININNTRINNNKNKLDKSNLQKNELDQEQPKKEIKKDEFNFTHKNKIHFERTSAEYKAQLKIEIDKLNGQMSYQDFENKLIAGGYKYHNFLRTYKVWESENEKKAKDNKSFNYKQKAQWLDRCTNENSRDYSDPEDPRRPF